MYSGDCEFAFVSMNSSGVVVEGKVMRSERYWRCRGWVSYVMCPICLMAVRILPYTLSSFFMRTFREYLASSSLVV